MADSKVASAESELDSKLNSMCVALGLSFLICKMWIFKALQSRSHRRCTEKHLEWCGIDEMADNPLLFQNVAQIQIGPQEGLAMRLVQWAQEPCGSFRGSGTRDLAMLTEVHSLAVKNGLDHTFGTEFQYIPAFAVFGLG